MFSNVKVAAITLLGLTSIANGLPGKTTTTAETPGGYGTTTTSCSKSTSTGYSTGQTTYLTTKLTTTYTIKTTSKPVTK